MDILQDLIKSIGPDLVNIGAPLLAVQALKARRAVARYVPKEWIPWLAIAIGGLAGLLPGMEGLGEGLKAGLLSAGAYKALGAFGKAR